MVILNCSPNGAGGGYSHEKAHSKWYNNKPKIWRQISGLLQKVSITNIDYLELLASIPVRENKPDFIYLDPPYFEVAHKGKLYREHNTIEWKDFKQALDHLEIHWLMSNRDCVEMRELFREYHQFTYNTYNDMNNTRNKNPELLVSNKPFKIQQSVNYIQKILNI